MADGINLRVLACLLCADTCEVELVWNNEDGLTAEPCGVPRGTRVLTPHPLSKSGEGACLPPPDVGPHPHSLPDIGSCPPSPTLGKGLGDGVRDGVEADYRYVPIESLKAGDLVLTHNHRFRPVDEVFSREYQGELLRLALAGVDIPLVITPNHPVARMLPDLPEYQARVATARFLRREATVAESHLWQLIRRGSTGVKFRRQQRLGPFIMDFYSPEIRLAVEVDGGYHDCEDQREYDRFRQRLIEQYHVGFARITNREVLGANRIPIRILNLVQTRKGRYCYGLEWLAAGAVRPGMKLYALGRREWRTVTAVTRFDARESVYDLRVTEDSSYVIAACTVHGG